MFKATVCNCLSLACLSPYLNLGHFISESLCLLCNGHKTEILAVHCVPEVRNMYLHVGHTRKNKQNEEKLLKYNGACKP